MRRCAQCQVDYPDALEFCPTDGARLPPLAGETKALYDPLIGSTLDGRYIIDAILGEGGMGVVYAGRHAIIDKRVAIKVLRKEAAADESSAQRFLAEAKAASKIGQQNIVDITDFGVLQDGHAYFVMEFIDGPTLGKLMMKYGPMAPARAAAITLQVSRGLGAAHNKGIVHRDLKPENIFVLTRDGTPDFVKIVDFGIARDTGVKKRLTVAGMVMGTPEYMAPEQASGQESDHRADQYAVGCILYEMLTGHVPFRGDNPMQTLTKHVFEALTPPSRVRPDLNIPPPLEAIVVRMLEKKRENRYDNLEAMSQALQAIEPSLRDIAAPKALPIASAVELPSDSEVLSAITRKRRRVTIAAVGAAVVGVVVVSGILLTPSSKTRPVAERADPIVVASPPAAVPPSSPPPSSPSASPPTIELKLTSVPPGAQAYVNDELLGVTPVTIKRPREANVEVPLVFRKVGYKEVTRTVPAAADGYVEVVLLREAMPTKHVSVAKLAPADPPPSPQVTPPPPVRKPDPPAHRNTELRNPFDN